MGSLFFLIPLAIAFVLVAIVIFMWAAKNKQFDDLEREASRILEDDSNDNKPV